MIRDAARALVLLLAFLIVAAKLQRCDSGATLNEESAQPMRAD